MDTREEGDVDGDSVKQGLQKRNAKRDRVVLWQDKIIPYEFDTKLPSKTKKHPRHCSLGPRIPKQINSDEMSKLRS